MLKSKSKCVCGKRSVLHYIFYFQALRVKKRISFLDAHRLSLHLYLLSSQDVFPPW